MSTFLEQWQQAKPETAEATVTLATKLLSEASAQVHKLQADNKRLLAKYRVAHNGLAHSLNTKDTSHVIKVMQECIDMGDSSEENTPQDFKNGAVYRFRMKGVTVDSFGDCCEGISAYDGQVCTLVRLALEVTGPHEKKYAYYDIRFSNGETFCAISGYHLDAL